jgi:hypothetical protein
MRDPFDQGPALRLGDAKANPRETGIIPNAQIVAVEVPKTETASALKSFDVVAESKRIRDVVARMYAIPAWLLKGPDPAAMIATQKAELDRFYAQFEMPLDPKGPDVIVGVDRGTDDVTITGIARKTADGAMRYEPAPGLTTFSAVVNPEVLSEEEFARRYPGPAPMLTTKVYETWISGRRAGKTIDFGEAASQIALNHSLLVKKDPGP